MADGSLSADTHKKSKRDGIEYVNVPALIIGAGAAGARAAIELEKNDISPLVVSKRDHGDAHTTWARGGINASLGNHDPEDSWQIHAADTLDEGHFINNPDAVEAVSKNMPERARELDDWGMDFSRTDSGQINQRYFGAQSFRRTCFAGDHTGESLLDTLVDKAQELETPYRDNIMVTQLLKQGDRVKGAAAFDMEDGHEIVFVSDHVVLAAGGHTAIYNRHSSREEENNGDGVALAYDAGAELMDMEFVQFHPTGMVGDRYGDQWDGRLVTEAVRGEGGRLFNSEDERFMERYSPEQMELDARDVVARAIETEVREGRGTGNGGVYLDISHRDEAFIQNRLPRMYERFQQLGVNIAEEPMEVAPTAHYAMGGVDFDPRTGKTSVPGLRVIGETTAGVHGANRLGGNSLAETVAIGQLVGDDLSDVQPETPEEVPSTLVLQAKGEFDRLSGIEQNDGSRDVMNVVHELGEIMEEHTGIRRDETQLTEGIRKLTQLRSELDKIAVDGDMTSEEFEFAVNLRFMMRASDAVLRAALERDESRGAHFREDFQEKDESQRNNLLYTRKGNNPTLKRQSVGQPTNTVKQAVDQGYELDYHHLE